MSRMLIVPLLVFLLCIASCDKPLAVISVDEESGLDREIEYVSAIIPFTSSEETGILLAEGSEAYAAIPVQILDTLTRSNEKALRILFPVSIKANASQSYHIRFRPKNDEPRPTRFKVSEDKFSIENTVYTATFSVEDDPRGGQINGIALKEFNDQLLKRGHIAMHWAPNFSKSDSERYFNFEDLPVSSENIISEGSYQITKQRSGKTDNVPEIDLIGKYTFYQGLPYFDFESTMVMNTDVELNLLRNDEMTMDSLFTHVVYRTKSGKTDHLELYTEALDTLETSPIPHDAAFVAFYHKEKGYGLGSIRLSYDNTNVNGAPSPVHGPYTKISKSSGNGRYWNRVLSDTVQGFPKGSRYHEKNAYLIFQVDKTSPEKEILYYQERLRHPLTVTVDRSN